MSKSVRRLPILWMPRIVPDSPQKIVVAQILPETWEFIRCLGAQNFMGESGQMWE